MGNGSNAPTRSWVLCDSVEKSLSDAAYFPSEQKMDGGVLKPNEFTICAYNVLSQSHVEPHNYKRVPTNTLDICNRLPHLYENVEALNSDILCLQEADVPFAVWVPTLNSLGYECAFKLRRKSDGVTGEAVLVAWKTSKFERLAHTCIEYYSYPYADVSCKRDQGAVAVLLRNRTTGDGLVVTSTHIVYNPNRGDIKASQAQMLVNGVNRWLQYLGAPVCQSGESFLDVLSLPVNRVDGRNWNNSGASADVTEQIKYIKNWLLLIKDDQTRDTVNRVSDVSLAELSNELPALDQVPPFTQATLVLAQERGKDLMYNEMTPLTNTTLLQQFNLRSLQVLVGADCNSVPESSLISILTQPSTQIGNVSRKLIDCLEIYEQHVKAMKAFVDLATAELQKAGVKVSQVQDVTVCHPLPLSIVRLFTTFIINVDEGKCLTGTPTTQTLEAVHNIRKILLEQNSVFDHAPSSPKWLEHVVNKQLTTVAIAGTGLACLNRHDQAVQDKVDIITNPLAPLQSAYQTCPVPPAVRPTSCQSRGKACVDHILFGKDIFTSEPKLQLQAVLDLPEDQIIMQKNFFLPNNYEPSDHFPIMARFAFRQ